MSVNAISWRLRASESPTQTDIQAVNGELLMAKGFFNLVYQPCIWYCRTASCFSQVTSPDLFPGGPHMSLVLKQEVMIVLKCLLHRLTPPSTSLPVSPSPPPRVYATPASICYISASLCCANTFVWQPNNIDTISSSGSPPGTRYLVWSALLACRHGCKVFFDDCQSPHHLDTHITATTGKWFWVPHWPAASMG